MNNYKWNYLWKIKKQGTVFFIIVLFALIVFSGCGKQTCSCLTIVPPDVTLTGAKTSVEKQIIGNYREIEKDAWIISNATGGSSLANNSSDQENKIFRSFSVMEGLREKMVDYQTKEIIGENNMGYLQKVSEKLDYVESAKLDIMNLIHNVNAARRNMYEVLMQEMKGSNLTIADVGKKFAEKYRKAAPTGSPIQLDNGKWIKK